MEIDSLPIIVHMDKTLVPALNPEPIASVSEALLRSGRGVGDDGEAIDISGLAICSRAAGALERLVEAVAPARSIEIGCASGASTLHIASGMSKAGTLRPKSIDVIDPKQTSHWKNMGRRHIKAAQLDEAVNFHEESAHETLPRLLSEGTRIEFVFIDGWHMIDYIMVEAFYCDLMLPVGGVISLHDYWMPATQHFASFWCTNRAYEPVIVRDGNLLNEPSDSPAGLNQSQYGSSPFFAEHLAPFVDCKLLSLRKIADDRRNWEFFREFMRPVKVGDNRSD